jgi:tetratricopeptide (TPR) repeat protein
MKRAEHLTIAEGFLELGMVDEAWSELDEIEPLDRAHPSVIAMRLRILERMKRFETGAEIARGAVRLLPEDLDIRLLGAAHIRKAGDAGEALRFLQESADTFRGHGGYWFAIACFHCQLGDLVSTAECTCRAIDLERSFQINVLDHPDLAPLRASWSWEG